MNLQRFDLWNALFFPNVLFSGMTFDHRENITGTKALCVLQVWMNKEQVWMNRAFYRDLLKDSCLQT